MQLKLCYLYQMLNITYQLNFTEVQETYVYLKSQENFFLNMLN